MENFWKFIELVAILGALLTALVLVLISLPGSRLRGVLLKVFSVIFFTIAGLLVVYVLSPLDLIPDFIPLLGQLDDVVASITALVSAVGGIVMYLQSRPSGSPAPGIEPPRRK